MYVRCQVHGVDALWPIDVCKLNGNWTGSVERIARLEPCPFHDGEWQLESSLNLFGGGGG